MVVWLGASKHNPLGAGGERYVVKVVMVRSISVPSGRLNKVDVG